MKIWPAGFLYTKRIGNKEDDLLITPRKLRSLYEEGGNISAILREEMSLDHNTREIIEISYDLQSGSYTASMSDEATASLTDAYSKEIAARILSLCKPDTILEAGVGEATTLSGVLKYIGKDVSSYGFDLSWSRIAYAKKWLQSNRINDTVLCTGDLLHIPFLDNSIDVVYTAHSIEPNGGNEEPILCELYRVTRKYLILLEPGFELATDEAKQRMMQHGYCKNLKGISESLGYQVLEHQLFPIYSNPLNPTAITIIKKEGKYETPSDLLGCPIFKTPLKMIGGMFYSPEALVVYPVVAGIPCLRPENGIIASKYEDIMRPL